jgi:hypothetical protein
MGRQSVFDFNVLCLSLSLDEIDRGHDVKGADSTG